MKMKTLERNGKRLICTNEAECIDLEYCGGCREDGSECPFATIERIETPNCGRKELMKTLERNGKRLICTNEAECIDLEYCGGCREDGSECPFATIERYEISVR